MIRNGLDGLGNDNNGCNSLPDATLRNKKLSVEDTIDTAGDAAGSPQEPPDHSVADDGAVGLDELEVVHRLHAVATRDQLVLLKMVSDILMLAL